LCGNSSSIIDRLSGETHKGNSLKPLSANVSALEAESAMSRGELVRLASGGGESGQSSIRSTSGMPWTIAEYSPAGDIIGKFDRGHTRQVVTSADFSMLVTSDGKLFSNGTVEINRDNGIATLWNPDTAERIWDSDHGAETDVASLTGYGPLTARTRHQHVYEADDGYFWIAGAGAIARIDPVTGIFTTRQAIVGGLVASLLSCPNAGSVISWPGNPATNALITIWDDAGSPTHDFVTGSINDVDEHAGVLAVSMGDITTLDASDLSVISTVNPTWTPSSCCTDGATAWFVAGGTGGNLYRAFAVTDLTTELWNATRTGGGSVLIYNPIDGHIYEQVDSAFRKFDPTDGTTASTPVWSVALGGFALSCRNYIGFGSDFVVLSLSGPGTNNHSLICLNTSDGSLRWEDTCFVPLVSGTASSNTYHGGVCVTADDRIFVGSNRQLG